MNEIRKVIQKAIWTGFLIGLVGGIILSLLVYIGATR